MTLIVGIKAAEGITLAADSLVREGDATFPTARKLFTLRNQSHIAVAFCGLMSLGRGQLLPASMLVEELDAQLEREGRERMTVQAFADLLSETLLGAWRATMPEEHDDPTMDVVVAGMNDGARYGEFWTFKIPTQPELQKRPSAAFDFAMSYWGNTRGLSAMIDPYVFPFRFMPLPSCIELAEFVIAGTSRLEGFSTSRQRVGGPVDVVTITQAEGVRWVRRKTLWSE